MAKIRLAIDFLQKVSLEILSDTELHQIEESINIVRSICGLNDDDVTKEITQYSSNVGLATVFLRIMQGIKSRMSSKTWPCLQTMRSACIELSDRFESFCTDLCSAGFLKVLIHELKLYQKTLLAQNAEEYLVVSGLCILENCAQHSFLLEIFWKYKAHIILSTYSASPVHHVSVPALIILGMMFLNADSDVCDIDEQAVSVFTTKLSEAVCSQSLYTEVGYIGLSASELVKGASGLALKESIAIGFAKREVLQTLLDMLVNVTATEDQLHVLEFIWTIATHSIIKDELCQMPKLLDVLNSLSDDVPTAKCVLFKIQSWKDLPSTKLYLETAFQQGRYNECVVVCESVLSSCSEDDMQLINLFYGKALFHSYQNALKYSNELSSDLCIKVVNILGSLADKCAIDDSGKQCLNLAMVECIRKANSLKKCRRCLLCHSKKQLKSSHVIPHFILSGFAKGMNQTTSKRVYVSHGGTAGQEKIITPRQAVWWMLCNDCEQLLSGSGESPFAKEFFHEVYKTTDPSCPSKELKVPYSRWLYLFACGIIFRGLAVNIKGITGFSNDDDVYRVFITLREILLNQSSLSDRGSTASSLQIAIFANPLSVSTTEAQAAETTALNRLLNMPGFLYLMETEEKLNHYKFPRVANFFLVHLGLVNIVVSFPRGDLVLPKHCCIDKSVGTVTIPTDKERLQLIPPVVWSSLVLGAQMFESQEIRVTQERLQATTLYDTSPNPVLEQVYGLSQAKANDWNVIQQCSFQPSSNPRFPKHFNLLPTNISVRRSAEENEVLIPASHTLLLHCTLGDENGVTYFLCVGSVHDKDYAGRPYVIGHRYMPGLYIDTGFFISEDLVPDELLPGSHELVYAKALLADSKSSGFFSKCFSDFLESINITLPQLLDMHSNKTWLRVKCIPQCWYCQGKCDVCASRATNSIVRYKEERFYCGDECWSKLIKPPTVKSALPDEFEIVNEIEGVRKVSVPGGHTVTTHVTTDFIQGQKQSGNLTMFLCKAGDLRPYVLCHFHNLTDQFSVGLYVSPQEFSPLELLPGSSVVESHSAYVESLYNTGIIQILILQMLRKHCVDSFEKILQTNKGFFDKRCDSPCWYCKDKCVNCFSTCSSLGKEYCSDTCQREKNKPRPHIFISLPDGLTVERSFGSSEQSTVTLPENHSYILHTTGSSCTKDGELDSEMTMIVCKNEGNRPYVIFQDYKPHKNRLASVAFYISVDDCSIENPMHADDLPGHLFVDRLRSPDFNIHLGIQEALKRRGFKNLESLLKCIGSDGVDTRTTDRKCFPPCWFCKHRCLVCLKPAAITTNVNGEEILHCSDQCLLVVYDNPGIICILPPGYNFIHTPSDRKGYQSCVSLPNGHSVLCHITRNYMRKNGKNGQFTLILCVDSTSGGGDIQLYALYHQYNLLRQITFGFYVSSATLEPLTHLPCSHQEQEMKCLSYLRQLVSTEPVDQILKMAISKHGVSDLNKDTIHLVSDTVCAPLCWYCKTKQ